MDIYAERCAGLDVSKKDVKAGVRTPSRKRGQRHSEVRTFATTTAGLAELREWLVAQRVELVVMESTGVYWKPVYYALEGALCCWLVNAQSVKKVPGRKTDVTDAMWLAQLAEHGLVRPSFVPPEPIRALRDLTRERTTLSRDRTRVVQRLHNVLEDASIKLSCVASDTLGVSGREMIEAMIDGQRDPHALAELARQRLRRKIPDLVEALTGRFSDHHARQCRRLLDHIDFLDSQTRDLDTAIAAATNTDQRLATARELLITIPGISASIAETLIAETGADMSVFPTAERLASWAGLCPGNNESAGRHYSGRTRKGNPFARGALGQAAAAAGTRTKNTYLHTRYQRIARRRGKKRALVAVAHTILVAVWHILSTGQPYHDLGPDWHTSHRPGNHARRAARLSHELKTLGYQVTLTQQEAA